MKTVLLWCNLQHLLFHGMVIGYETFGSRITLDVHEMSITCHRNFEIYNKQAFAGVQQASGNWAVHREINCTSSS